MAKVFELLVEHQRQQEQQAEHRAWHETLNAERSARQAETADLKSQLEEKNLENASLVNKLENAKAAKKKLKEERDEAQRDSMVDPGAGGVYR